MKNNEFCVYVEVFTIFTYPICWEWESVLVMIWTAEMIYTLLHKSVIVYFNRFSN